MPSNLPNENSWNRFWAGSPQKAGPRRSWAKKRIERILLSAGLPKGKVLDAGCGSGYFSKIFCDWGWDAIALDYSGEALEIARRVTQNQVRTVQADLVRDDLSQKIASQEMALIFSDGLFEHFSFPDQDRILKNFYSVLSDEGAVVTFVPNRWSPWQLIRPLMMPGIHEQPFVLSALTRLHERNGFEIVSAGGVNVLPFRFSPEFLGKWTGMILYVVAKKKIS